MNGQGISQIIVYAVVLTVLGYPLGIYMARIYTAERLPFGFLERGFLQLVGNAREQTWRAYGTSVLVISAPFFALLYLLQRVQAHLFLNPDKLSGVPSHISLNTAASFVTNTNWQYYGGEYTMSYLTQMAGLAVQNFVSAGVGMAVLAAVVRGIARRSRGEIGNFWQDLYRSCVYILLPLAVVLAVILISQGVVQTFNGHATATTLEGAQQTIARGPAASQIAIKQLGTNGGGFYNSNSSVPFENPNGLSNFFEMLAILLIPAGQVFMFGRMVLARRHALMVYIAMFAVFAIGIAVNLPAEQHGSAVLRQSGVNLTQGDGQSGGNMSDKEVRFGLAASSTWTVATSDASNGSVNSGFDAQTPAGGAVPLVNIFLGEVIFGGVGSGLYGMFFYIVIAVFVAGLMVGRTPEWLGKKIEAREIKLAAIGALFVPSMVLFLTALAISTDGGLASIFNSGVHGFTETLYAYDSQGNNNGSAFAGYGATNFSANFGAIAMLLGRFVPLLAALALGGSLAAKRAVPESAGTFRTDGGTFVVLLVGVIGLTAGLMIFPALTLGPIVEGLMH
jgi:potassium-transporting ATPase potassium-binding subunit